MKKRRFAIVAFLLCATLIMGIGYAAVNGMLMIGGKVTYNPLGVVEDNVDAAVKFTAAEADTLVPNCTAEATFTGDNATLNVVFNNTGDGASYEAIATYTVKYDTEDMTYPKVSVTVTDQNAYNYGSTGWDVDVYFGTPGTNTVELVPGQEAVVTVVVTNDGTAVDQSNFIIDIELTATPTP